MNRNQCLKVDEKWSTKMNVATEPNFNGLRSEKRAGANI